MTRENIDNLLLNASNKGSIHVIGPREAQNRSIMSRLRTLAAPVVLGAALLTVGCSMAPKPEIDTNYQQKMELVQQAAQDFDIQNVALEQQLQQEIAQNGANAIVMAKYERHDKEEYLQDGSFDLTNKGQNSHYTLVVQTPNPNSPNTIMAQKHIGVSKDIFDAVECVSPRIVESKNVTSQRCETSSSEDYFYVDGFYGGPSQLKIDYNQREDGSFDMSNYSLRIANVDNPTEFRTLDNTNIQGDEASQTVIDESVNSNIGDLYQSAKLSASKLQSKIEQRRLEKETTYQRGAGPSYRGVSIG